MLARDTPINHIFRRPVRQLEADVREVSASGLTPAAVYRALRGPAGSVLLETDGGVDSSARESFIGLDPLETFVLNDEAGMVERIRERFEEYRSACAAPPRGYGFLCTFAYDAALKFQNIPAPARTNRLFGDAYTFVPGTWLAFDPRARRITLSGLARSRTERAAIKRRLDDYVRRLTRVGGSSNQAPAAAAAGPAPEASLSKRSFLARVALAQRAIRRGDVYQLQVGIRFACDCGGEPVALYERFQRANPSPCEFLIERNGSALVGASPEFLVRLTGRRVRLRPLAGTRPRGATPEEDAALAVELAASPKERAEHVMLVDLGRNDLSLVCRVGSVRVDEALRIERFSHVMHFASSISGDLAEGRDAFDLFAATFPAGTVTGTPKRRAMELIAKLEPTARDAYSGSVAHFRFDGSMDACLTLRSVALDRGRAYWQASAGIVDRSDPDAEYAEVLAKTGVVRAVLGTVEPGVA